MCDYSLMALPNRLAVCGEELATHKFQTGSMGLVSMADSKLLHPSTKPKGFFEWLYRLVNPPGSRTCTTVCIPPRRPPCAARHLRIVAERIGSAWRR